jgi:hypothetical protein
LIWWHLSCSHAYRTVSLLSIGAWICLWMKKALEKQQTLWQLCWSCQSGTELGCDSI